jgi:hypothetical protein
MKDLSGNTRDTAVNLMTLNPVIGEGKAAIETDTGKYKMGDGITAYNSLPYVTSETQNV